MRKSIHSPASQLHSAAPRPPGSNPTNELDFLSSEGVLTYAGEWVAISNARVVAHGSSLEQVKREAESKLKGRKPTYFSVPSGAATY